MVINMDLLRDLQRIFEDDDLSFINNSLSIPLRNKQILNKFKGDDRIIPIIAKFHDISRRTEIPKLVSGEFIVYNINITFYTFTDKFTTK